LNRYSNDWPKIEIVANAPDLVPDSSMIYGVGVNPTRTTIAYDVSHPVEHPRSRLNGCARIPDEENIRLSLIDNVLNTCG